MTSESQVEFNPLLMQLIISLQTAAMMEMGKLMNPQTQTAERRLPMAKNAIDMLTMLRDKTTGNLSSDEQKYLEQVLYELRMNFLEESEKPDPAPDSTSSGDGDGDDPDGSDSTDSPNS